MKDTTLVLRAINDLPFPVGKNLLINILQGRSTDTIEKHDLDENTSYASMAYTTSEVERLIQTLTKKNLVEKKGLEKNKNWKVLYLTQKGKEELQNPSKKPRNEDITKKEKQLFNTIPGLQQFNTYQKRAITTPQQNIIVIAGPGTGKTTILTERIKFLTRYKGISPNDILALTYTRKAKNNMHGKLSRQNIHPEIHTFHSYAEKEEESDKEIASTKQKIQVINTSLDLQGLRFEDAIEEIYSKNQLENKSGKALRIKLIKNIFHLLNLVKLKGKNIETLPETEYENKIIKETLKHVKTELHSKGLKTHADQLLNALQQKAETYEHVLIDEYQDINDKQKQLVQNIQATSRFYVGDPRQSIYGWRGSNEKHVKEKQENDAFQTIYLTKNYRSKKEIITLYNKLIQDPDLPDIEAVRDGRQCCKIKECSDEDDENVYIKNILDDTETLILCRKNKDINKLSTYLDKHKIRHGIKKQSYKKRGDSDILLATVHAAKGLEAERVIIKGANDTNYPCRTPEDDLAESLSFQHDHEEEEKKLFYVALSRAKDELIITHTGKKSRFINDDMMRILKNEKNEDLYQTLKEWNKNHDFPKSVLLEISKLQPTNKYELKSIPGISPKDIEDVGDKIIEMVP